MKELRSTTEEGALEMIRTAYDVIESLEVYYALKEFGMLRITEQSQELVRWCAAIESQGLFITTHLLKSVMNRHPRSLINMLHRLGDNGIITLVKKNSTPYRFMISQEFKRVFDPEIIRERVRRHAESPT